jgi:HAD superfamily hydrolase (TIGR01509 family)
MGVSSSQCCVSDRFYDVDTAARRNVTAQPKLVIFDCDGVLVDSEAISSEVLATLISDIGVPTTPAEASARYQGLMLADIGADVAQRLGSSLPPDFWERFDDTRQQAFERSLQPIRGAAETIGAIQAAGIRTCVASQGRLTKTELTLGLTGLREYFTDAELFSAYSVARGKPHPDLFLHAAAEPGFAPRECLVVEDAPSGMQAAIAAEMVLVAYVPDGEDAPEFGAPVSVIRHLPELIELVLRA